MSHKGIYRLTRIPPVLWVHVKRVAAAEGHSIREVILRKLEEYVTTGFQHPEARGGVRPRQVPRRNARQDRRAPPRERHHGQGLSTRRRQAPGPGRRPHGDQWSGCTSGERQRRGPRTSTGSGPAAIRRRHGRLSAHDSPPDWPGSDSGGPWRNAGVSRQWRHTTRCHALPTAPRCARCRSPACSQTCVPYTGSRSPRGSRQSALQSTAGRNNPRPGRGCSAIRGPPEAPATSVPQRDSRSPADTLR